MNELTEKDVMNGFLIAYNQIQKFVHGNKTREKILESLKRKERLTWTDMQKKLDINPNMIRHHTKVLLKAGLIEKSSPGFKLSNAGKAVMTMKLEEMIEILKIGAEIYRRRFGPFKKENV